jgi:hypothetical protein
MYMSRKNPRDTAGFISGYTGRMEEDSPRMYALVVFSTSPMRISPMKGAKVMILNETTRYQSAPIDLSGVLTFVVHQAIAPSHSSVFCC